MKRISLGISLLVGLLWLSNTSYSQNSTATDKELGSTMSAEELFGSSKTGDEPSAKPTEPLLSVSPAAEASPALRYQFWPNRVELKPGSANVFATRALVSLKHMEWAWARQSEQTGEDSPFLLDYDESPSLSKIEPYSISVGQIVKELRSLALCEDQTRDLRIRDQRGSAIYTTVLPEIQESRSLARALRFRIRTQILKREFPEAIENIKTGFRLAEYIGDGETLIERLVGTAIASTMLDEIEFLIQQPDSPNLYWALASLPHDTGDPAPQAILELSLMERHLPILEMAEKDDYSDEIWLAKWAETSAQLRELLQRRDPSVSLLLGLLSTTSIEAARTSLIQRGMDAATVKEMSKFRAVLLNANQTITEITDSLKKGFLLPEPDRRKVLKTQDAQFSRWLKENPNDMAGIVTGLLVSPISAANQSGTRTTLRIRRLMALEAIRDFVATEGKLPESLQAIRNLPVPNDPYTEDAFKYSLGSADRSFSLSAETPSSAKHLKTLQLEMKAK